MKKILLPLLVAGSLFANEANIEITNNTIMLNSSLNIPQNQNFALKGGYLFNNNSNKDNYYYAGIQAQGETFLNNYNANMNIFMNFVHTTDNNALPLGVGITSYQLGNLAYPIFVKAEISYAPSILSFDNANRFFSADAQIGIIPIQNAKIFIGYRKISFNQNYQSVAYAGIGFIF